MCPIEFKRYKIMSSNFNDHSDLVDTLNQLVDTNTSGNVLWHVARQQHLFMTQEQMVATMPIGQQSYRLTGEVRSAICAELNQSVKFIDAGTMKITAAMY